MTSEATNEVTAAVLSFVSLICRYPDDVHFTEVMNGSTLEITLSPRMEDMGCLIGKDGKQIKAIKFLAEQMGRARGFTAVRCNLIESYRGGRYDGPQFVLNPGYRGEDIQQPLIRALELLFGLVPSFEVQDKSEKLYFIFDVDDSALPIILALGSAFYPVCYRGGRKVHFRIKGYQPDSDNEIVQRSKAPADP